MKTRGVFRYAIRTLSFVLLCCACTFRPVQAQWLRTVWAWPNSEGVVGQVPNLAGVVAVAAGAFHNLALKRNGTVWAWGANYYGELGNGTTVGNNIPVPVSNLTGVAAIAAGGDFSLALKADGTVWAWGDNGSGELGDGTNTQRSVPVCAAITGVIAIAAGQDFSLAVRQDGTVWVWGANSTGQLGNGTINTVVGSNVPVLVSNLTDVVAIARGDMVADAGMSNGFVLALKRDGTVWAWGLGTPGNGTDAPSTVPVQAAITGVVAISAGLDNALALKADGTVWTWGGNGEGELGNGSYAYSNVPVQVSNLTDVVAIAGGGAADPDYVAFGLALKKDGTVWAWGDSGTLGNGSIRNSDVPVQVAGLTGVAAIAAGGYSAVAIRRGEPFDLTGYGHNDLLWRNASDGALVYRLMSGSVFTGAFGTIAATILNDWQVVGQPDIDGDGILDLLWQNMSTGDVTYWIMSGSQFAGTWGYVVRGIPLVWRVVAAADMDGDGFPDLVYQNAQTGDVTYLQVVNGQFTGVWGFLSQGIDPIWKVIGAVDLFNDGNNDLVWWNSQTGEVTYLRMQGATWTGEYDYIANTMATVNTSWRAVGMADFTGDGYPDIVWQNTQTGDVTYYEVTISWTGKPQWDGNWGFLAQGTDPVWQLTGMR